LGWFAQLRLDVLMRIVVVVSHKLEHEQVGDWAKQYQDCPQHFACRDLQQEDRPEGDYRDQAAGNHD
jgi:hypothetical protein